MTGRREMDENDGILAKYDISILIRILSKEIYGGNVTKPNGKYTGSTTYDRSA